MVAKHSCTEMERLSASTAVPVTVIEPGNPTSSKSLEGTERKPSNPVSIMTVSVFSPLGPTTVMVVVGREFLSSEALAIAGDAIKPLKTYPDQVEGSGGIRILCKSESLLWGSGKISFSCIHVNRQIFALLPFVRRGQFPIQALTSGSNGANG